MLLIVFQFLCFTCLILILSVAALILLADFVDWYTRRRYIKFINPSKSTAKFSHFPPLSQNYSIPEKIVYYLAKNSSATSLKACHKLSKTCKYFYSKNGVIFVTALEYGITKRKGWGWNICSDQWSNYFPPEVEEELKNALDEIESDVLEMTEMPLSWPPFLFSHSFNESAKIRYIHQLSHGNNLIIFCAQIPECENSRFKY